MAASAKTSSRSWATQLREWPGRSSLLLPSLILKRSCPALGTVASNAFCCSPLPKKGAEPKSGGKKTKTPTTAEGSHYYCGPKHYPIANVAVCERNKSLATSVSKSGHERWVPVCPLLRSKLLSLFPKIEQAVQLTILPTAVRLLAAKHEPEALIHRILLLLACRLRLLERRAE